MGGLSGIIGKGASLAMGVKFSADAIEGFNEGNLLTMMGGVAGTYGAIRVFANPKQLGKGLVYMAIGAGMNIISAGLDDGFDAALRETMDEIGNLGIFTGILSKNPWIFTIGLAFKLKLPEKIGEGLGKFAYNLFNPEENKMMTEAYGENWKDVVTSGKELKKIPEYNKPVIGGPDTYTPVDIKDTGFFARVSDKIKSWFGGSSVNDAIITPSGVVNTDPADYIIATKNPEAMMGGGSGVNLNVTYNVNVSDKRELEKMFDSNNRKLTEDVRRLINT